MLGSGNFSGALEALENLLRTFPDDPQLNLHAGNALLALGEAEPETVEIGVPAVLFSRVITGPLSVVIAYFASFGLYKTSE